MQIIINKSEIDQAILDLFSRQIAIQDGVDVSVDLTFNDSGDYTGVINLIGSGMSTARAAIIASPATPAPAAAAQPQEPATAAAELPRGVRAAQTRAANRAAAAAATAPAQTETPAPAPEAEPTMSPTEAAFMEALAQEEDANNADGIGPSSDETPPFEPDPVKTPVETPAAPTKPTRSLFGNLNAIQG